MSNSRAQKVDTVTFNGHVYTRSRASNVHKLKTVLPLEIIPVIKN
jgi:hypothetical protein